MTDLADVPLSDLAAELDRRIATLRDVRKKCRPIRERLGERRYVWAQRCKEAREWLGLNMEDAAMYGGCSQPYVSMCEAGKRPEGARRLTEPSISRGCIINTVTDTTGSTGFDMATTARCACLKCPHAIGRK